MNKLSIEEKVQVVACLVEGNSLRATTRTLAFIAPIQNLLIEISDCKPDLTNPFIYRLKLYNCRITRPCLHCYNFVISCRRASDHYSDLAGFARG